MSSADAAIELAVPTPESRELSLEAGHLRPVLGLVRGLSLRLERSGQREIPSRYGRDRRKLTP